MSHDTRIKDIERRLSLLLWRVQRPSRIFTQFCRISLAVVPGWRPRFRTCRNRHTGVTVCMIEVFYFALIFTSPFRGWGHRTVTS